METNAAENGPAKFTRHFPLVLDCKIIYHAYRACETGLVLVQEHVELQLAFPRTRYTFSLATRISFQEGEISHSLGTMYRYLSC